MKNIYSKLIIAIFFILVFSIFLTNSFSYLDTDFGWHLKAGEEIYKTKQVPWLENYNYTLEGKTWVDHEWILNLISYLIFIKLGYFALNVFFALVGLLIFILLNFVLLKDYFKDALHAIPILFFEIIGLIAILPHSGVRMQEFSVLFLLLEIIVIEKYLNSKNFKILYYLPLIFFIWVNLHGGFLIGIVILWFFLFVNIFIPKIINFFKIRRFEFQVFPKNNILHLFLVFILSCLAVFITPYHYKYFSFMFSYTNTFYLKHIAEWLPAYSAPLIYFQQLYFILFILILVILFFINKNKKINLWYFLLNMVLLASAFKSRRNFPLFFIASLPLISVAFESFNKNNFPKAYSFLSSKYLQINLLVISFLSILVLLLSANFTNSPFQNQIFCQSFPCAALDKIKSLDQENIRIFNDYGSGGWLTWNWPDKKIFIDGRLPMLTVNNHSFLEEYYEFFDKEKIPNKLEMYQINLVLGKKFQAEKFNWFEKTFLGFKNKDKIINELEEYIKTNNNWILIFEDNNTFVYQKK